MVAVGERAEGGRKCELLPAPLLPSPGNTFADTAKQSSRFPKPSPLTGVINLICGLKQLSSSTTYISLSNSIVRSEMWHKMGSEQTR